MSQISKCLRVTVVLSYWEASGEVSKLSYKSLLFDSSRRSYCIIIIETRTSGDVGTLCHMIIVVLTCCVSCIAECDEYIQIFVYSNIFDPNIYSGIRSYHFLDMNIFR